MVGSSSIHERSVDDTVTVTESELNSAIQINYPGSGNESIFVFDGVGDCVQITDYSAGIVSGNKQFV